MLEHDHVFFNGPLLRHTVPETQTYIIYTQIQT